MTSTVWLNTMLAVPFLLAFIGIPLWLTWKHTDRQPDFADARAYLAAKRVRIGGPAIAGQGNQRRAEAA